MQLLDLVALWLLAITTTAGWFWGALRQVIAVAATLLALAVAGRYYAPVDDALSSFIADPTTSALVAYLWIFVGIAAIGGLVASTIHRLAGLQLGRRIDAPLGALLGVIEGCVVAIGLAYGVARFPPAAYVQLGDSLVGQIVHSAAYPLAQLLPDSFRIAAQQIFG